MHAYRHVHTATIFIEWFEEKKKKTLTAITIPLKQQNLCYYNIESIFSKINLHSMYFPVRNIFFNIILLTETSFFLKHKRWLTLFIASTT